MKLCVIDSTILIYYMDFTGIFEDEFGLCSERIIVTWEIMVLLHGRRGVVLGDDSRYCNFLVYVTSSSTAR